MLRNVLTILIRVVMMSAILMLGSSCSSAPTIKIEPSVSAAQVDDKVTVLIKTENIANLTAYELHLSFDPAVLEVVSMTNGGVVAADFIAQNTFDNAAGTIDYAVGQINRSAAKGSGTLFEIVFRAKASGTAAIRFYATPASPAGVLLSDTDGKAIQALLKEGNVKVR
ncbi:MAG: cohesin domain-containing protein [Chloroflexi bacterium]|nr:cohesin domain-containing protein [Chloroflexota bacterium]